MTSLPFKKNQEIEITIEDLVATGKGLARIEGLVAFIHGNPVPLQKIIGKITKVKSSYLEVKMQRVIEQSPYETQPLCPYFGHCGGCRHQNIHYQYQIKFLEKQVKELYTHLGSIENIPLKPIVPAESQWRYRNKMEFAFSNRPWLVRGLPLPSKKDFALGLRVPDNYYSAIDIADCLIAPEESAAIIKIVRDFAIKNGLTAYDTRRHVGNLRHLVLRNGHCTNQIMVNILTSEDKPEIFIPLVKELVQAIPNIHTIINSISTNLSGVARGEKSYILYGPGYIEENVGSLKLKISPESFFQTNTVMAEKLYSIVKNMAQPLKDKVVWDLYCGTGSIALFLARDSAQVIGIEIVPEAIEDARINAKLNGIENATFLVGDLDKYFKQRNRQTLPNPDIIVIDPPRGGMNPNLSKKLRELKPEKIIYVSCNPATQVRDIKILTEGSLYNIVEVQPIDLFPHTPHVEVVTQLNLAN